MDPNFPFRIHHETHNLKKTHDPQPTNSPQTHKPGQRMIITNP